MMLVGPMIFLFGAERHRENGVCPGLDIIINLPFADNLVPSAGVVALYPHAKALKTVGNVVSSSVCPNGTTCAS